MSLQEQINADLKNAMLSGDKLTTTTLRMLKAAIIYANTADGTPVEEPELIKIIRREVKKRTEAAAAYRTAENSERAEAEEQESLILEHYLPAQADIRIIEPYMKQLIAATPNIQKGDLIRQTLSHFEGTADGRTVSELAARLLT